MFRFFEFDVYFLWGNDGLEIILDFAWRSVDGERFGVEVRASLGRHVVLTKILYLGLEILDAFNLQVIRCLAT